MFSPSMSGSDDGSPIFCLSYGSGKTRPKIPDMWRPSIMAVLNDFSDEDKAKKLSGVLRSEITLDLVTQMYTCVEKIDKPFCTNVAKKKLVLSILS